MGFDVLMITNEDNANTGWRFSQCLRHYIGLDVLFFKGKLHPFYYPEQGLIHPALAEVKGNAGMAQIPELKQFMDAAKVVHFIASFGVDSGCDLTQKPVVVQHGGRAYRNTPDKANAIFNPIADATIIQMPDILGLGAKNEQWIYYPVDTDFIQPHYDRYSEKLIIGHFPSQLGYKGTAQIIEVIKRLQADPVLSNRFEYFGCDGKESELTIWTDHLRRVAVCDIYVENLCLTADGRKYGEWGNQAIEAAALGKIVVTNSLHHNLYQKEFGDCALHIANSPDELEAELRMLLSLSDAEIQREKEKTRAWVEEKHSMPVTAQRLWDKVYSRWFS